MAEDERTARLGRRRPIRAAAALALVLALAAIDAAAAAADPSVPPPGIDVGLDAGADGGAEAGVEVGLDGAGVAAALEAGVTVTPGGDRDQTRGTVPVGPRQVFVGDWETGDFRQWEVCQSALTNGGCGRVGRGNRAMAIVDAPGARQGDHAARFTVRRGDKPDFGGGERSEVQSSAAGALVHEGDERWYEWSVQYPQEFPNPSGGWFIILQWHSASGSPPLAVNISNRGTVDIGGDGVRNHPKRTIGPVRRGEWVDYVLHVRFSRNADRGFVEAWENGRQTVPRTARATMVDGENYLKQGIYRDTGPEVSLVQDGLRVTAP